MAIMDLQQLSVQGRVREFLYIDAVASSKWDSYKQVGYGSWIRGSADASVACAKKHIHRCPSAKCPNLFFFVRKILFWRFSFLK